MLEIEDTVVTTGVFNHDPNEQYGPNIAATLLGNGWTQNIMSNQDGSLFAQLTNSDGSITQIVADNTGYTTISVTQPK